jgi:hypothetical protein
MIIDVFKSSIWKSKVNNFEEVQKEVLRGVENADFGYWNTFHGKSQQFSSKDYGVRDVIREQSMHNLSHEIMHTVMEMANCYNRKLTITHATSWLARYQYRDHSPLHNHYNGFIDNQPIVSGVYMYDVPENDNSLYFAQFQNYVYETEESKIRCNNGDIIIFPPGIPHGVFSNPTEKERITLIFNLYGNNN